VTTVDPAIMAFLTAAEPAPLRDRVGLSWLDIDPTRMVQELAPPSTALEADGRMPIGLLAVLADSTVGSAGAVAGGYRFGVTLGLRIELAHPLPDGLTSVVATSSVVHADVEGSLVTAVLTSPSGESLGWASMRALTLTRGTVAARTEEPRPLSSPTSLEPVDDGIDSFVGVYRIEATDGRSRLQVATRAELKNGAGRLHGGIVAAIAQRGAHHAIASTTPPGAPVHHLVLDVDMVRPVPPGGGRVEVQAGVLTRTRRFAWAESEVLLPDGRVAARARIVAAISGDTGL